MTATTVRYLFASKWAAHDDSLSGMHVPGAKVEALNTAANLLVLAVWSLREQGLVEVQQLRPVKEERVMTMGGHSSVRVRALAAEPRPGGLEGALLAKASEDPGEGLLGRFDDLLAQKLSGDDAHGLRGWVLALNLNSGTPWTSVANFCRDEARAAGIVELKGRLRRRPMIADPAAHAALEPRDAEIAAARKAYRKGNQELDDAVLADSAAAISWARTS